MFPIRDHNPSQSTPFVNYAIIVANVLIFLSYAGALGTAQTVLHVYGTWAVIPARVMSGDGIYTLVTSQFLHGGWMHILGNMLFLYVFGDNLEDRLGHLGYLAFYLAAGVAAALAQVWADPTSSVPLVGASGAIAGVMGGYLLLFPKARVDVLFIIVIFIRIIPIPAWAVLGIWFALQVVNGLGTIAANGGVAYWAHVGGFVVGGAMMLPIWLRLGGPRFWQRGGGMPQNPAATYRLVRTDVPRTRGRARPMSKTSVPKTGRRRGW